MFARITKYFTSSFPFCELRETFLAGPHGSVDDLQEKLAGSWIEDEDRTVDGLEFSTLSKIS